MVHVGSSRFALRVFSVENIRVDFQKHQNLVELAFGDVCFFQNLDRQVIFEFLEHFFVLLIVSFVFTLAVVQFLELREDDRVVEQVELEVLFEFNESCFVSLVEVT